MLELLNRIRNFDYRKLTPTQIIIGIAVTIIALWLLSQLVSLLTSLVPIAILVLILYFGFRMLNNRSEAAEDAAATRTADDNVRTVEATVTDVADTETMPAEEAAAAEEEFHVRRLRVEPKVNPKTGLPEADLSRLEELEQQTEKVTDDVMAQIEARRRRLMGEDNS
ncbi:hypothetical protein G4Y79_03660 [Phototrophicus methaneseepsis]|uniref:Uncharacterized protein n=1 Tax=Phototrophicus methaneseepsis TaxID=2710758 RepID=A0A7S8IFD7_9CHLR|nr:hypothetical protein [Phototrophicus methaneseepsis]QPC83491.1 hypothetical protein G4Y79_03660 [Phototrophicus methaneseepsis]